jgi:hypothetical protein
MADQTITPVAAAQTAPATTAVKAPEASTKPAEATKTEASGTIGTTAPSVGAGTKVNYYA